MLGKHIILELHGVDPKLLNDRKFLEQLLTKAAREAGGTIIGTIFHEFNPHGVTGIVAICESHISIHTWPEFKYAAVDVFTCRGINPEIAAKVIIEGLKPEKYFWVHFSRGEPFEEGKSP